MIQRKSENTAFVYLSNKLRPPLLIRSVGKEIGKNNLGDILTLVYWNSEVHSELREVYAYFYGNNARIVKYIVRPQRSQ